MIPPSFCIPVRKGALLPNSPAHPACCVRKIGSSVPHLPTRENEARRRLVETGYIVVSLAASAASGLARIIM